jgi:hypothetical protein
LKQSILWRDDVTTKQTNAKLAEVKLALAAKCDNLARLAGSTPKRKTFQHHAAKFRREAADLARR